MKFFFSFMLLSQLSVAATVRTQAQNMMNSANEGQGRNPSSNILNEKLPNQVNALSMVDKIRTFEPGSKFYTVTFWEDNRVFRVQNTNALIPCLENSFKSERPVTLGIDKRSQQITECKMFGGTHPGMRKSTAQGTGSAVDIDNSASVNEVPDNEEAIQK